MADYDLIEAVKKAYGAEVSGTAASQISTHASKTNAHQISGIDGLQAALDGKLPSNAVSTHEAKPNAHPISGVAGLQSALDSKATTTQVAGPQSSKLDTANIVGPIGGGSVIEGGSNANGSWVKYADGTMICGQAKLHPKTSDGVVNYDFPYAFSAAPTVTAQPLSIASGSLAAAFISEVSRVSETLCGIKLMLVLSGGTFTYTEGSIRMSYIAFGRWK